MHDIPTSDQLLALIVDGVNVLAWQNAGKKGSSPPKSVHESLTSPATAVRELTRGDIEDFDAWYAARFANN